MKTVIGFSCVALLAFGVVTQFSGCTALTSSEPIEVEAEITGLREGENNKVAQYSQGMYQQFFLADMEITSPEKYKGRTITVNVETRIMGDGSELLSPGSKIKFLFNPRLIGKKEPCDMSELLGYEFIRE